MQSNKANESVMHIITRTARTKQSTLYTLKDITMESLKQILYYEFASVGEICFANCTPRLLQKDAMTADYPILKFYLFLMKASLKIKKFGDPWKI
ncbi:hypothetical protein [Helicobacter sp. MIT 05-5294]|uniref:hypothetical protein n=1 Tax=Helicobacter sp. MIT 05-5294 TaxID=1548150 RepID=UPI00051FB04E|nr:hypothetical protein [Helicobacter sp. MIT 05-5294]TLD89255.1 hypothetical protein LS69_001125 [Helicobacter sp. MIT 05-5294]